MLAKDRLIDALNAQVGNEFGASMQYIAIASYFSSQGLAGLARFFYRQAEEEREHAMKFVKFIVDAGGALRLPEVPAPQSQLGSAQECVALALASEKTVTDQIYGLVEIAQEDKNYIALNFLDWFVEEQFEEVTSMEELLQVVERAGEDRLLSVEGYLDREGKLPAPTQEG